MMQLHQKIASVAARRNEMMQLHQKSGRR